MNIVLIGFMGSGKSAVGRALTGRLGGCLIDTDGEIEREAGKSIAQVFADEGEAAFRAAETALLRRLLSPSALGVDGPLTSSHAGVSLAGGAGTGPLILSTGGGMPLRPENARLLRRIGHIVWLVAPPESVLQRVGRNLLQRPLLAGHAADPLARIKTLAAERGPRYAALADLCINTESCATPDAVAARIIARLRLPEKPCQPPRIRTEPNGARR